MMDRRDMQNAYKNQSFIQNKSRMIASYGSTCGAHRQGCNMGHNSSFQGVLYGHQRHTLTTSHFALKPTAIAAAQTYTIMPSAHRISRADHTIRGHSYWPENSACVSRHLDFRHLPPLTLTPPQASLKRTSVDVIHFVPPLPTFCRTYCSTWMSSFLLKSNYH